MLAGLVRLLARWAILGCGVCILLSACAVEQGQGLIDPSAKAELMGREAIMADGYRLPYRVWEPKCPAKGSILALHGFNDYSQSFAGVAEFLAGRGYRSYAYDQRGFGGTASRGQWAGRESLIGDVRSMAALIKARDPHSPLFLLGESMGGAVALLAAADKAPPPIDGLILAAPAVWSKQDQNPFLRALFWSLATAAPSYKLTGKNLHILPSDNFNMLRGLSRDPQVIKTTRIDALYGAARLMDEAAASVSKPLSVPSLILYGRYDRVIPKPAICRLADRLADSPNKHWQLRVYPRGFHLLTRDLHADEVLQDIAGWLQAPGKPRPDAYGPEHTWLPICEV
jgi:alpha-beta hydrolase superfamily lysophospholipase